MRITIPNRVIPGLIELLGSMYLTSEKSRARTKLLALARQAEKSLGESELDILREHVILNDAGEPIVDHDGNFTLKDPAIRPAYDAARETLLAELVEISGPTYVGHEQVMLDALRGWDGQVNGEQAEALDVLWDALESAIGESAPAETAPLLDDGFDPGMVVDAEPA